MPLVLTAYCCGTWYDSNTGDLISDLWKNTTEDEDHWKLIFAGPGSGQILDRNYQVGNSQKREGEYRVTTYSRALVSQVFPRNTGELQLTSSLVQSVGPVYGLALKAIGGLTLKWVKGLAFGEGMAQNVEAFLSWVANALSTKRKVVVNLVGWSRGAVTCHLMANAAAMTFGEDCPVMSIFAIDPVPGDGNINIKDPRRYYDENYVRIPAQVVRYRSIIMSNAKMGFMPVVPVKLKGMDFDVLYMPGDHGTAVEPADGSSGPVELTRWLVEDFLAGGGTSFGARARPSKMLLIKYLMQTMKIKISPTRWVWFMGAVVKLQRARFLSAFLHETKTEWAVRLAKQAEELPLFSKL